MRPMIWHNLNILLFFSYESFEHFYLTNIKLKLKQITKKVKLTQIYLTWVASHAALLVLVI
jgi:hypothetical protein